VIICVLSTAPTVPFPIFSESDAVCFVIAMPSPKAALARAIMMNISKPMNMFWRKVEGLLRLKKRILFGYESFSCSSLWLFVSLRVSNASFLTQDVRR
jgi:hypothetical protein